MGNNIDDLADKRTSGIQSTGEKYHDEFLMKRSKAEWSPYIDETAKDLCSGIQISDFDLSRNDFGRELGAYYRRGLKKNAGRYADLPSVLEEQVNDEKLGLLAYQLNELSYDISTTDLGIDDVEKATEAVIEKLLTRHVGEDLTVSFDLSGATVSDITTQLFNNEAIAANVDLLLTEFENSASRGLLSLLDTPQMMTPLWAHQRDALQKWWEHDQRGYVDMATATGKTVLGLSAIALQYGELHPDDQAIGGISNTTNSGGSDDVLIVAHSELILEQWRREFENHLNIPQERTTGSDDITLEWGTIHFRTPQSLVNEDRVEYDLVLLDEAHHYATGSEWGSLLDEFNGNVLAMSGSVDDAGSNSNRIKERLSNSIGPEIKRYTIIDAREDGVIPSFDWEVHYAPYDIVGDDLEKTATRAERSFRKFHKRITNGELTLKTDRRLRTYEDVRRFSHTKEGTTLKQQDEDCRDLVTRLFSRRTKRWNLSPVLDAVVELVIEHHTTENVIVLADSNAQVEELESLLHDVVAKPSSVHLVSGSQSREEQRETVSEFDQPESAGVLLGTGDLLGEGVDMQHASVAINMATGGVNQELVQRIGRVLRNPVDTPKHAMFYNVVGVPPTEAAAIPREDGKQLIEQAAGFCSLGRRFNKLPGFATATSLNDDVVATLLDNGAQFIDSLDADGEYEWDTDTINRVDLTALHNAVTANTSDTDTILGEWEEYAWEHSEEIEEQPRTEGTEEKTRAVETQESETVETVGEDDTNSVAGGESDPFVDGELQTPSDSTPSESKQDAETSQKKLEQSGQEDKSTPETLDEYFQRVEAPEQAQEYALDSALSAWERVKELLESYEAGELQSKPGQTLTETLTEVTEETLRKSKSSIAEIISQHHQASVEEPSLVSIIELGQRKHPYINDTVVIQDGELCLNLDDPGVGGTNEPEQTGDAGESVQPNELAEYYELFRKFDSLLERLIESEQTAYRVDGNRPINEWRARIDDVVFGSGPTDGSPNYGRQQGNRNPHTMSDYRAAFGDGDTVTEYQTVRTELLSDDDAAVLVEQQVIEPGEQIVLPVTPESNIPLPIAVSSDAELDEAIALLEEFPAEPDTAGEKEDNADTPSTPSTDEAVPEPMSTNAPSEPTSEPDEPEEDSETDEEPDNAPVEQTIFWDQDTDPITEFEDDTVSDSSIRSGDKLDSKIDEWKSQLLDLTRRNKLISFKPTKSKSLPFEATNPTSIAAELDENEDLFLRKQPVDEPEDDPPALAANELQPTRTADEAANSLSKIGLTNKQYLRERGVDSLYLSLGMLRWYSVDYSDEANRSPLFLAPVELEERTIRDSEQHDYVLKPKSEELQLNPALRKKLAAERNISLPADNALSLADIDAAFKAVYETLSGFDRWTIQPDVILGIFDFTKFSLYTDLERNRSAIKDNAIIQALNGNTGPIQAAEGDITTPTASELDETVDPIDTYQVLDADSSQQEAIEAAKRGKSFVLQGPPGTGKSQTISNIIAEKLAAGERVLFVSEKQAALNVVKNRLDNVGLGRFCLEVHGGKATNTDVLGSLKPELKTPQIKPATDRRKRLQKLQDRRDAINQYGQQLFFSPPGWGVTAYQAFGIVSDHTDAPRISIGVTDPVRTEQSAFETTVDELETLARFDDVIDSYDTSPWRHTTLRQWGVDTGDSMRDSLTQQMATLDTLDSISDEVESALGTHAASLADLRSLQHLLRHVSHRPDIAWQRAFFDGSLGDAGSRFDELADLEQERDSLIDELSANYQRSFFSADGAELNNELAGYGMLKILKSSYRSLKRKITNHAKDDYAPSHDELLEDTRKLAEVQRIEKRREDFRGIIDRLGPLYQGGDTDWETLTQAQTWVAELDEYDTTATQPITQALLNGTLPDVDRLADRIQAALDEYDDAAVFFHDAMDAEQIRVNGDPIRNAPLPAVADTLDELHANVSALQRRVQFEAQLDTVRNTIGAEYIEQFLDDDYDAEHLVAAFKKRFYTKWLNSVYEQTDLGSFNADEMERYVEEFRQLDLEQQELAKIEVQHEVTKRRPSLTLEHASSSAQVLVRRETEKQRRHKPLRELFDEAGSFITQLTPCFMMSPLSVAQFLKADSIQFDTVVFDEASQIMPQDAVSSLIRADQAIIAGDTKQLPPTSFFQSDVETTEDVREDLDSILEETASVLPEKNLRWHYRSRTDELIQFSNHHYYNNNLRTFPENNPDVETGVEFEYVEDGVYDRGGSRQNTVEADRVIDLIEEHADTRSNKSLGVVAFSSAQEQAIRDALAERREDNPVLDSFVSQDDVLDEFFIKNLEMVQGDERDRMIFSIGYGPAQDGTISTNFGPLNKSGGERRLNVAVTRAKEQITVVCSMLPGDIDLSGSNSTGAKHFKNYLEYARNGEQALLRNDQVTDTLDFDSQFEEAVYDALTAAGHDVVTQVNSSSYSIDLAIKHPDQPGKFVLGIECDGAAYHSSKTARDRDRTRQTVLEDLGWTIHRIWSPDWTSNKAHQIEKINQKIAQLIETEGSSDRPERTETKPSRTIEPESVPDSGSWHTHPEIESYISPDAPVKGDKEFEELNKSVVRNRMTAMVREYGPLQKELLFKKVISQWGITRLGQSIRKSLNGHLLVLQKAGKVTQSDSFVWPPREKFSLKIRLHDNENREIDAVPLEELAKAAAVILTEGGQMTTDDLALETARLYGYQRRGTRIQNRIRNAISILETKNLVETIEPNSIKPKHDLEAVEKILLNRIYS